MPLLGTENQLGQAIANAIAAQRPDETQPVSNSELANIWIAVSEEIINHYVANTIVTTTVVGAVTSGSGAGGVVTGTGSGTIG